LQSEFFGDKKIMSLFSKVVYRDFVDILIYEETHLS